MAAKKIVNVAIRDDLAEWFEWAGKNKATTATAYVNMLVARDRDETLMAGEYARRFAESRGAGEPDGDQRRVEPRPSRASVRRLAADAASLAVSSGMGADQWRTLMDEMESAAREKAKD